VLLGVARADAMQDGNVARTLAALGNNIAFAEHRLKFNRGDDIRQFTVAVLFDAAASKFLEAVQITTDPDLESSSPPSFDLSRKVADKALPIPTSLCIKADVLMIH